MIALRASEIADIDPKRTTWRNRIETESRRMGTTPGVRSAHLMQKKSTPHPNLYLWIIVSRALTLHRDGVPKTYSRPTGPNSSGCREVASPSRTCQRRRFHSQPETRDVGQPAIATPCLACVRQIALGYCLRAGSEIPGPSRLRPEHFPATERSSRTMRSRCAEMLFRHADEHR
jgi:hypothetical protein